MRDWQFTLIVEAPAEPWTPEELQAARGAGLNEASFGVLGSDAYALVHRRSDTFGAAVGGAIDELQHATGRIVVGVQREPG